MSTDEEKISSIYQQGKEQGPSAQMDKAILDAAHEAVNHDANAVSKAGVAKKAKSPFSGSWPAMASIAAVLLITVLLVPLIKQETPPITFYPDDDGLEKHEESDSIRQNEKTSTVLRSKNRSLLEVQKEKKELTGYQAVPAEAARMKQLDEAVAPMTAPAPSAAVQTTLPASNAGMSQVREPELKAGIYDLHESSSLLADKDIEERDKILNILAADKWLEKIRDLITKSDFVAAQKELDELKEYYPDEEIDPKILKQIDTFSQEE